MTAPPVDVHTYYRQVTDVDIGDIAREVLAGRITHESRQTLFCDCPNHRSQSHRSLHVWLDKQGWFCHACGTGGDVLQLVEFVRFGVVTRGQFGSMPDSHRQARDFLAERVRLPPLSTLASGSPEQAEEAHQIRLRVREALTASAAVYHRRLVGNPEVLAWFRGRYGISEETIGRLQIGYAENGEPSVARTLMDGPGAFTMRELTATSVFRPTAQDGLVPFFDGRIVFPYWSRGQVVFMIGRRTPWTPDQEWEKSKYKKLAIRNDRNNSHVSPYIRNDVLYNEDVLLAGPERVIITEGVTDCISLMEHGFPVVSPVTVQIREADWERLLPKLAGVKTVYICQDNEISEAGMQGALKTARFLSAHGIATRVAVLPLSKKQLSAREKLGALPGGSAEAEALLAEAKIDVNEFFASGKTAADFEGTDGQMWREFTGTWWEAYREEPKRVGELNQFCEERDLMLSVRGDGSARSQQTRLGKALATKRDRVFNGLTVKQSSHNNHKTGVLYALALADGGDSPGRNGSRSTNLLDLFRGDIGGDMVGTFASQRPHQFGPIESIGYGDGGDGGDLGDIPRNSRAQENRACIENIEGERENNISRWLESATNVPTVPTATATDAKQGTLMVETLAANVPTTSQQRPHVEHPCEIDPTRPAIAPVTIGEEPP